MRVPLGAHSKSVLFDAIDGSRDGAVGCYATEGTIKLVLA